MSEKMPVVQGRCHLCKEMISPWDEDVVEMGDQSHHGTCSRLRVAKEVDGRKVRYVRVKVKVRTATNTK